MDNFRKFWLVVAMLLLATGPALASTELRYAQVGSTFTGKDYNQGKTNQLNSAGLGFMLPVADLFRLRLDLLGVQVGGQSVLQGQTERDTLTYLQAPIMLGFSFLPGIEVFGGWYASKLLVAYSAPAGNQKETPSNGLFNDVDTGWTYGASLTFFGFLRLDARQNIGINSIIKPNSSATLQTDAGLAQNVTTQQQEVKNSWTSMSVGILF